MKKKKITAIQIVGGHLKKRPDPAKLLKELKLDTDPEWTIHNKLNIYKPFMV